MVAVKYDVLASVLHGMKCCMLMSCVPSLVSNASRSSSTALLGSQSQR